jgi:DNA modification methylase
MSSPKVQIIQGDSSKMDILRNEEADLVLTSPPYFSNQTEIELKKPIVGQTRIPKVKKDINEFALSLAPNYKESERVLREGGYLITQTMDIYYGGIIIPLTSTHIQILENLGFNLITRFYWHKFKRNSSAKRFLDNPQIGKCRSEMIEDICVFCKGKEIKTHKKIDMAKKEIIASINPLWDFVPVGKNKKHPHQTPKGLVKRLISLYSDKGDLVVDPFAGSGTTLKVAQSLGRNSLGYEIDPYYESLLRKELENG